MTHQGHDTSDMKSILTVFVMERLLATRLVTPTRHLNLCISWDDHRMEDPMQVKRGEKYFTATLQS
jgi:hypothetical protein